MPAEPTAYDIYVQARKIVSGFNAGTWTDRELLDQVHVCRLLLQKLVDLQAMPYLYDKYLE